MYFPNDVEDFPNESYILLWARGTRNDYILHGETYQ